MRTLSLLFSILCVSAGLFSQQKFTSINGAKIESYSNVTGLPLLVSISDSKNLSVEKFSVWLNKEFLQDDQTSIVFTKKEIDPLGMFHYRFEQYYQNIKIESSMIIAHCNHNIVKSFNGDWFSSVKLSNGKSLTEAQALQFALNKVKAQTYKWENEQEEAHMKAMLKDPSFTYKPIGELVIVPVIDSKQKTVVFLYAYKFNIYAEKPLYRANVYVDASTGQIIKEQNLICTSNVIGTANTRYSGSQTMTSDNYTTGGYRLRETGRGNGIETYNLNNTTSYTNTDFTNNSSTWSSTGIDQVATDAHWGAEKTYDYYNTTFNRNSIDDNGFTLLSYVHYDTNFTNAFWDGQRMTYGDGDISLGYKEFTALDVCGHEITHGLVQFTAQLSGGESDALNEGFADIFGTAVEWYARPLLRNWLMGEDLTTNHVPFRNLSNPNALQQPDTYFGTNWDPNNEPHNNNGPCIYWYYLLSVGGNGVNDNSQSYNITGISMAKASAIAYRALSIYMTPNTDYANVRAFTIQAAKDLYGSCSNEAIQTTNAWYAVGVGSSYLAGAIIPDFIVDEPVKCTVPATANFINQTNSGSAYMWYFGDGATSTSANPAHTYTASGIYSVKLVATSCTGATKDSILKTSYVNVNTTNPCTYIMPASTTTYSSCTGKLYDDGGQNANYNDNTSKGISIALNPGDLLSLKFNAFDMESGYDFLYVYKGYGSTGSLIGAYSGNNLPNNGLTIATNTNVITIIQSSDQFQNMPGFELQWNCISSSVGVEELTEANEIMIYPNPADQMINLHNIKEVTLIEITNALGEIEQSVKVNGLNSTTLYTNQLSAGIYFIKLYTTQSSITKKMIKQ